MSSQRRLDCIIRHVRHSGQHSSPPMQLAQHSASVRDLIETAWAAFVGRAGEMMFESAVELAFPKEYRPTVKIGHPFVVIPPADLGAPAAAFEHLVGTFSQQAELRDVAAFLLQAGAGIPQRLTRAFPNKPVFVILAGPPGSGKTQHAREFSRQLSAPLILLSPANATKLDEHGRTPFWQAFQFAQRQFRTAVILIEDIDIWCQNLESVTVEIGHTIDGATALPGDRHLAIVATTCKPSSALPVSLLHRAFRVVNFSYLHEDEQLIEFWMTHLRHISVKTSHPVQTAIGWDGSARFKTSKLSSTRCSTGHRIVVPPPRQQLEEGSQAALCEVIALDASSGEVEVEFRSMVRVVALRPSVAEIVVNVDTSPQNILPLVEASRGLSQRELVRILLAAHVKWTSCLASWTPGWRHELGCADLAPSMECLLEHVRWARGPQPVGATVAK